MDSIVKIDPITLHSNTNNRPFTLDITYKNNRIKKPVVLHIHGFKGFKDWGFFNLAADHFGKSDYVFIKMNFSHNGTTPENPIDFVDLEAFGNNNFSIEQDDIGKVIDFIFSSEFPVPTEVDLSRIFLTGHSRGGAAAILKGFHDNRITGVATWAAVNDLARHFSKEEITNWEKNGVTFIENSRTGQQMPLYYQLAEDFKHNESKLSVPVAIKEFQKPLFMAHGTNDPTVPVESVYQSKKWNPAIELLVVDGADHVFGATHPWAHRNLPEDAKKVISKTVEFFNRY